jgi:hypothetical protein
MEAVDRKVFAFYRASEEVHRLFLRQAMGAFSPVV